MFFKEKMQRGLILFDTSKNLLSSYIHNLEKPCSLDPKTVLNQVLF